MTPRSHNHRADVIQLPLLTVRRVVQLQEIHADSGTILTNYLHGYDG